jgi:hypothetical protein
MLTTGLLALLFREEGSEAVQPLAAADEQIVRGQRIGQFLQPLGVTAAQEGVGGLLEIESLLPHALGEPVMLVETDAGGKGEVGAPADEPPAPAAIVAIKVILRDPALRQLQMPSVVLFVAD